jgi:pimeloyl-ACP methyl ester carboxylesterase
MIESSLASVYGDPGKVTPELVDRYFELATREGNRAALVERFKQTQPDPKATERLAQLRQPTLILWGGRDRLIRPEFGDRFAQDIPGSRLVVFEYLGHVPQEEDPARTVAALEQFLDGTTENVDGATRPQ